ncbi:PLP-dependent aminotransferase family protein [Sporolactobacillus laevolacticus]|uniref:MocR-like pyridoxine biosynthesis transcription factor PdxR n=1 Tax=Sporolactobacillus laevolacticus TaxID=33018 RepID=UPI0025B56FD4|nr:PLP-dependent aminotransferase family protein [Sporolactobacillus laevolacticus]MDN3954546.1 PLP-dependent aminotransferase family protein [Sporolactobacillus laevolacticus]
MRLDINRNETLPVYMQIANRIKEQILSGILPAGFVLPPERKMADDHAVSRTTVIRAYEELKALGLVASHRGKGTVVTERKVPESHGNDQKVFPLSWYPLFDKKIANVSDTVSELMHAGNHNDVISLAAGIGDPNLYPISTLQQIQRESPLESDQLNLSPVEGLYSLRESISRLMTGRNLSVSAKEVMILAGSMQGIDFAARALLSPGDAVIVEEPTFLQAIQCFRAAGAKIIGIPIDREGIRLDVLEAQLARYKPKFIYTIPAYHNPTGVVMSIERRKGLLDLAYRYQVPILEDDPYGDISFAQEKLPPLKALDPYGYVIYLSTFSKVLFPGLRIGWTIAPEPVMRKFALLKQIADLHVNTPGQFLVDQFLRKGYYEAHLRRTSLDYQKKRDVMAKALTQAKGLIHFEIPDGGFYFWCRIPYQISQKELLALCSDQGVIYTPGNVFYPQESDGEHWLRLNFTYESMDRLERGLSILINAVKKLNKQSSQTDLETGSRPIV